MTMMSHWSELLLITVWLVAAVEKEKKSIVCGSSKAVRNDSDARDLWPVCPLVSSVQIILDFSFLKNHQPMCCFVNGKKQNFNFWLQKISEPKLSYFHLNYLNSTWFLFCTFTESVSFTIVFCHTNIFTFTEVQNVNTFGASAHRWWRLMKSWWFLRTPQ